MHQVEVSLAARFTFIFQVIVWSPRWLLFTSLLIRANALETILGISVGGRTTVWEAIEAKEGARVAPMVVHRRFSGSHLPTVEQWTDDPSCADFCLLAWKDEMVFMPCSGQDLDLRHHGDHILILFSRAADSVPWQAYSPTGRVDVRDAIAAAANSILEDWDALMSFAIQKR